MDGPVTRLNVKDCMSTANAEYEYYWSYTPFAEEVRLLLECFGRYADTWMRGGGVQIGPPQSDVLDKLVMNKWVRRISGEFVSVYWLTRRGAHVLGLGAFWGK